MVTENAVPLKRILEVETEVECQKRFNTRLIAESDRGAKPVSLPQKTKILISSTAPLRTEILKIGD
jgi:hypothetical protein